MANHNESIAAEVLAAAVGGAFSSSALYPLEVIKTRMQAEKKNHHQQQQQQSPIATLTKEKQDDDDDDDDQDDDHDDDHDDDDDDDDDDHDDEEGTSKQKKKGEKSKTNQNLISAESEGTATASSAPPTTMVSYARHIYKNEGGISAFYSGMEASAFQSAMEKALYFFGYTILKNAYRSLLLLTNDGQRGGRGGGGGGGDIGTLASLILGAMADWCHLPITLPIDCLTTKIQTDTSGKSPYVLLMAMLSERGLAGMYRGIGAYAVLCLRPAIQYTVFERIKRLLLLRRQNLQKKRLSSKHVTSLTAAESFFLGMLSRAIATIVVFPYTRAKVMIQSAKDSTNTTTTQKKTIPVMIADMYQTGGLGEVFRGLGPELTRGVMSAALMMMVKEQIASVAKAALGGNKNQ